MESKLKQDFGCYVAKWQSCNNHVINLNFIKLYWKHA